MRGERTLRVLILVGILSMALLLFGAHSLLAGDQPIDAGRTENAEAVAVPEDGIGTAATTTQYQHVAGTAFHGTYPDSGVTPVYAGNGCVYLTGAASHGVATFPVIVPNGSVISQLRLYFRDTNPSAQGRLWLVRYDDGAAYEYIVPLDTVDGATAVTASQIDFTVDYVNYNYNLVWVPYATNDTVQLCGYRLAYTPPGIFGVAIPLVTR